MKINGRGKLGIEDARSKMARNACDIQRVSGKCSPGMSEQQFFFPNNLECISVCLEYNKRGKILVGHRFKTIAQTASQEKCKREFYKTLSKVHDTLRPIDTFVFSSYFSKKKNRGTTRSFDRKNGRKELYFRFFRDGRSENKMKRKGKRKNTFTPIGYGDNPRNLCLESEQASCNLREAESCIDRHF